MDCSNFIVCTLKNKTYCLYSSVLKDIGLFQQFIGTKDTVKLDYEKNISFEDIDSIFNNLFGAPITEKSIESIYNIYNFMIFLKMKTENISKSITTLLLIYNLKELVEFGLANNYEDCYYEMVVNFCTNTTNGFTFDEIKNLQLNKNFIKSIFVINFNKYTKIDYDIYYGIIFFENKMQYIIPSDRKHNNPKLLESIYNQILNRTDTKISILYQKDGTYKFDVNDKNIKIVGDTQLVEKEYIGINLKDTVLAHIATIIFDDVIL